MSRIAAEGRTGPHMRLLRVSTGGRHGQKYEHAPLTREEPPVRSDGRSGTSGAVWEGEEATAVSKAEVEGRGWADDEGAADSQGLGRGGSDEEEAMVLAVLRAQSWCVTI